MVSTCGGWGEGGGGDRMEVEWMGVVGGWGEGEGWGMVRGDGEGWE